MTLGTVTETKWEKVRMDDLQELPDGEKQFEKLYSTFEQEREYG